MPRISNEAACRRLLLTLLIVAIKIFHSIEDSHGNYRRQRVHPIMLIENSDSESQITIQLFQKEEKNIFENRVNCVKLACERLQ